MSQPADPEDAGSELSLRALLDNAPDAVARFDRNLRHVYVNAATARANNRPAHEFYGKTMRDLGHSEEVSREMEARLNKVFDNGQEQTFDVLFASPCGNRCYECRMAPELNCNAQIEHVVVFSRDLTLQRETDVRLHLIEKQAALARLENELAHQINNPLQGLRNTIYLLQRSEAVKNEKELLNVADELLQRVENILGRILSLKQMAKGESCPPTTSRPEIDLTRMT